MSTAGRGASLLGRAVRIASGCARALPVLAAALAGCAAPTAVAPPPEKAPVAAPAPAPAPPVAPTPPPPAGKPVLRAGEIAAVVVQPGDTLASLAAAWLGDPAREWEIAAYNDVADAVPGEELAIPLRPWRRGGLTPEQYQTVPVLVYHQIAEKSTNKMVVSRAAFEAQMRLLKEKGYRVVTLDQLLDFVEFRGQLPPKSVVITIDDGWRSVYDLAFPILKQYGYPATLFVYTQLINGGAKSLSWDQLREMAAQGLDVQCHTVSHRNLALPLEQESAADYYDAIRREIEEATRLIEQRVGRRPRYLAYPYGDTNGVAVSLLRQQGYRAAFTVVREANPFFAPPFRLSRAMVYGDFDLARFEKNLAVSDRKALR